MTRQRPSRPGLRQFLRDLKKADALFWLVLILSIIFIAFRALVP